MNLLFKSSLVNAGNIQVRFRCGYMLHIFQYNQHGINGILAPTVRVFHEMIADISARFRAIAHKPKNFGSNRMFINITCVVGCI